MKGRSLGQLSMMGIVLAGFVIGCTQRGEPCGDFDGYLTHSVIDITGVESVSIFKRAVDYSALEAVDPVNGIAFANVLIDVNLSWTEEQYRNNRPTTILQSLADWFVSPASACSPTPYYEDYQPAVVDVQIHSDTDLNADFIAGTDLSEIFNLTSVELDTNPPLKNWHSLDSLSGRRYTLDAARQDDGLVAMADTPATHVFTILITLEDGRAYETRSPAVLFSDN